MDKRSGPVGTDNAGGYLPPVDLLLALGSDDTNADVWPDYRALGLDEADIPELRRMALDPRLHLADPSAPAARAPWHACAALAQLGATQKFPPPRQVPRPGDHDWRCPAMLVAAAAIGSPGIPALQATLENAAAGAEARTLAAEALGAVIVRRLSGHAAATAALTASLDRAEGCDRAVDDRIGFVLTAVGVVEAHTSVMWAVAAGRITTWWEPHPTTAPGTPRA